MGAKNFCVLSAGKPSVSIKFLVLGRGGLFWDAAFLLAVGSFLLTGELFYLQLTILAFLLTVGAIFLTALAFLLTVGDFCLQWESASNKGLKGL